MSNFVWKVNVIVFGAAFVLAGCAVAPKVTTDVVMPAKYPEATKLRRIAVLPVQPRNGIDVTPEIESTLAAVDLKGQRYFTVVERNRLKNVLDEMKLGVEGAGMFDDKTVQQIGKLVGAEGMYAGAISRADVSDEIFREDRQRCVYMASRVDGKGRQYTECGQYESYIVNCTKRTADFAFIPKLIEVSSATIKYSRTVSGRAESKSCPDSSEGVADRNQLLNRARSDAIMAFRRDVAPYQTKMTIELLSSTELIKNEKMKEQFTSALAFSKEGRMDRACEMFNLVAKDERASPDVIYNVAACLEIEGDLDGAKTLYTSADRLTNRPVKPIGDALARVDRLIKAREEVASQSAAPSNVAATQPNPERPAMPVSNDASPPATSVPAAGVVPAAAPVANRSLSAGSPAGGTSQRARVAEAQSLLNKAGFNVGTPDGISGPRTTTALKAFQSARKLPETGQVDDRTLDALRQ